MSHLRRRLLVELSGFDIVDEPFGLARRERLGADLPTAQVLGLHGAYDLDPLAAARGPDQVERRAAVDGGSCPSATACAISRCIGRARKPSTTRASRPFGENASSRSLTGADYAGFTAFLSCFV